MTVPECKKPENFAAFAYQNMPKTNPDFTAEQAVR
jgi:hypothetical protein